MRKLKLFALPYILWMVVFTVLPMFLIVYYAFTNAPGNSAPTLEHFFKAIDPMYMKILLRSIWIAFLCTALCLLLGYPVAFLLARARNGAVWSLFFILPMWMNFLLRTYAWMSILENTGILNSLFVAMGLGQMELLYNENAVILGMVYNFLPFMILPIYTNLQKQDVSLLEAAQDLGCNGWRVFTRVTLPLSMPGVVSGITMVFMPAVTTFAISRLLSGGKFLLFGDIREQQYLSTGNWNVGSMLSLIMLAIILLSMGLMSRFGSDTKDGGGML